MEQIEQRERAEDVEQRHPANTLNDGSPLKFLFVIPALLAHTAFAVFICPIFVVVAGMIMDIRPSYGRYFWPGFILNLVFSGLMGYAWTKRLDRWLFGTSRWVWVIPGLFLATRMLTYRPATVLDASWTKHFFGRIDDPSALSDQLYVMVAFVCAVGYAIGGWYWRRRQSSVSTLAK